MKPSRILRSSIAAVLSLPFVTTLSPHANAASGTWTPTAAGTYDWNVLGATGWTTGIPNASGDTANINIDILGAQTINLATGTAANRTITDLNLGDLNGSHSFTIASGVAGSTLIFAGTNPSIDIVGGNSANTISAPIQLQSNMLFRSNTTAALTLSGVISNNGTVRNMTFNNDVNGTAIAAGTNQGQFVLSAANTAGGATGVVSISDVRVNAPIAAAFGANAANTVTMSGAGQAYLSAGTHVNNLVLNSTGWVETAGNFGALRIEGSAVASGTVTMQQNSIIGTNSGTGTISGIVSGAFSLSKAGAGNMVLSGANTYTGTTFINAGTLTAQNNLALGTAAGGTTVASGAALNLGGSLAANALNLGAEVVTVIGTGVGGTGALLNTGSASQQNALQQVVLAGDATFGGSQRWDIRSANPIGASLSSSGGPFSVTKVGTNYIPLVNVNVTNLNQFVIQNNGIGAELSTVLTSGNVSGGVLVQPTGTNTSYLLNWGNFVTHTTAITLDTSSAGSTARLEVQNGNTTFNGAVTITGAGTNNLDVDPGWAATLNGSLGGLGNLNKVDGGALILNSAGNTHSGILNVNGGILGGIGTVSSSSVNFAAGTTISPGNVSMGAGTLTIANTLVSTGLNNAAFNIGTASDKVIVGTLTQDGTTTISVVASPGFAAGTYTLFDYGTLGGANGFAGYKLGNHIDGNLVNNTGAGSIDLVLTTANPLKWTGLSNNILTTGSLTNPVLPNFNWPSAPGGDVEFVNADNILFDDSATGSTTIFTNGTVAPGSLRFNNTTKAYTIDGVISGSTGLVKDGTNTVTFLQNQTFNGPVSLNAGTIQLGSDSRSALISGASSAATSSSMPAIAIAAGATLGISAGGNAELNVANDLSGSGSIILNASQTDNYFNITADRGNVAFRGDNSGFTGAITINDGNRLRINAVNSLGNASGVTIADGGAMLIDSLAPVTYSGSITVAGKGWHETGGDVGALRLNGGAELSGPINLTGDTRITAYTGGAGKISGVISGGATDDVEYGLRQIANNGSGTLDITNPANSYGGSTSITRATVNAATIANSGVNSSLGSGSVVNLEVGSLFLSDAGAMTTDRTININQGGQGGATIGLTTAGATLTITGAINNGNASFPISTLDFQNLSTTSLGTGGTIILNTATPIVVNGTTVHRQNLTLAGSTNYTVGTPATGTAAAPFGFPGAFNLGNNTGATNTGPVTLTIQDSATLTTYGNFDIGNQNTGSVQTFTINQIGGTVNALRGGGSFNAGTTDEANRAMRIGHWTNTSATYNLSAGTLNVPNGYVGLAWDGNGTLNQSVGTTANIRGIRMGNAASVVGIYNLDGGTLNIGDLGIIRGNATTTNQINLNGGTLRATADFAIGSGLPINANIGGAIIDTNGFNVTSASAILVGTGGSLTKIGNGELTLPTGNSVSGGININGGSLSSAAAATITASTVNVNNGGTLAGGFTISSPLGVVVASGGTVSPGTNNGAAGGTLTTSVLTLSPGSQVNLTPSSDLISVTTASTGLSGTTNINVLPVGTLAASPINLINYTTANALTFTASLPHLVAASVVDNATGNIQLIHAGQESLTWTGGSNGTWDTAGANVNFNASASGAVNYLQGDVSVFDESTAPANPAISIATGGVTPASVTINDVSGVFSFTGGGINGGTALTKTGAGTTVLATNNTYTGVTTISAGTLQIGNGGTAGTLGSSNTTNNGTLSFNRSDAVTYSGVVSGSGVVRSDGTGTTNLLSANTYSGGTVISKGTMVGRAATSFGTGAITLNDASTGAANTGLYFNPIGNDTVITIANNLVVANQGTGTVSIGSNERSSRAQGTIFTGTLSLGRDVTLLGEFDRTTFTGAISGTADTITIAPSPGLSAGQAGRVTWEGVGSFTPATAAVTTINVLSGAIFQVNNAALTDQIPDTATVNVQAGGVFQVGTALDSETIGTLMGAGTVRNVTNTPLNITFGTADDATFSGVINGGNQLTFIKQGSGTTTWSGILDNPAGNVTVNSGTVVFAKDSTPTVHAVGGNSVINAGGVIKLGGTFTDTRPEGDGRNAVTTAPTNAPANYVDQIYNGAQVTVNVGGILDMNGKSDALNILTGAGTVTNSGGSLSTIFIGTNGGAGTFSGLLEDGAGGLRVVKSGAGVLTLSSANTYSGETIVNGNGAITISHLDALGSIAGATSLLANRDGVAQLNISVTTPSDPLAPNILNEPLNFTSETSGDQRTNLVNNNESTRIAGAITVSGDGLMQVNANQAAGDQFQINGPITGSASGILFLRGNGEMQINSVISAPNLQIAKTDGGLLILNSTGNDYLDISLVNATVRTDVANALDTGAVLRMGQGGNTNTLDINGNNQTVAAIRLNLNVADAFARTITNNSLTPATFTVNTPAVNGGNFNYAGNIAGLLKFVKTGPGKQVLSTPVSGINSFTEGTLISGGTLTIYGDGALGTSAGAVEIANNAILQANGTVTTTLRTLTLGTGGGTIDTNGNTVTYGAGSTVTGSTLTKVGTGKLVLSGTQTYSTLDAEDGRTDLASALGTGTSSIIANADVNISVDQTLASLTIGDGAVVTLGSPLPPAPAEFAPIADLGGGELVGTQVQGVPEPGSAALLFGGMLTLLGMRRRR